MTELSETFSQLSIGEKPVVKKTGLIYDYRMKEHYCSWDLNHIERPERLAYPLERCKTYGLLDRCVVLPSRYAEEEEISLLHDPEYVENVKKTKDLSDDSQLESFSSTYDSVYFNAKTYESALLSAGCSMELVSSVLSDKVHNGMAIVRPPGHHAMVKEACGFCVFNNVALAAKYALLKHNLKRILIVDWDVHHGQGTQQIFYRDPRVLYFSIHRFEHGAFWPYLRESDFDFIGEKEGKGFNINVPLNKTKLGNTEYLAIFHNILLPVAYEFNPELVLISAGYDAALGCPEGEMEVTPSAYAHMLNLLTGLANGRLCVILEGGYCLPSLSESVALTLRTLLGDPCPKISPTDIIDDSVVESILNVITVHRSCWQSLHLQKEYLPSEEQYIEIDKSHIVKLKYVGSTAQSKPVSYPTRDYYPVQEPDVRLALESKLEKLIGKTDLTVPNHRTCLVYDPKMNEHINKKNKDHLECSERLVNIYNKLEISGILKDCLILSSRKATKKELTSIHSDSYVNKMESTAIMKCKDIVKLQNKFKSVYICQATYDCATLATGSLLQAVDAVLTKECLNGFALIRPPGHHAEVSEACGFCIFNHVAIATKYAMDKYFVQKVLILDWDVHHGNGTQHIFYKDDNVLYISLHRYDDGSFFPCEADGSYEACGEEAGLGFNINISWNDAVGDGDYFAAFAHIILPIAYEFCPDLVLVSAGFDAAQHDPLGECELTPAFFGHMTKLLSGLANGKMILSLEGGYNLESTSEAAVQSLKALLGKPCEAVVSGLHPSAEGIKAIQNVVQVHQKYWKCLQFGLDVPLWEDEELNFLNIADHSKISMPVTIPNRDESCDLTVESPSTNLSSLPKVSMRIESNSEFNNLPHFYCVSPLDYCPHLELLQSIPPEGLNPNTPCQVCSDTNENWVCLHCYQVYCGRFINEHMLLHGVNMQHYLTLSYKDLSVWCYGCDSYVHNPVLMPVKQHVHFKKFGMLIG